METKTILQPLMTVEEVLKKSPDSFVVFMNRKTKCVGCLLQRFCTLQDVSATYQIPLQELIAELEEYIPESNQIKRSSQ